MTIAESGKAFCGNGIVEEGEECDCGYEEDCTDTCCNPRRTGVGDNSNSCTRKINPSTGSKYDCRYSKLTFIYDRINVANLGRSSFVANIPRRKPAPVVMIVIITRV